jgi:hypothetical protein
MVNGLARHFERRTDVSDEPGQFAFWLALVVAW